MTSQRKKNRPSELHVIMMLRIHLSIDHFPGIGMKVPFHVSFHLSFYDHCGKERVKESSMVCASRKTFARALAWAQAEA